MSTQPALGSGQGETCWHSIEDNETVLKLIGSDMNGLSEEEAARRLVQ